MCCNYGLLPTGPNQSHVPFTPIVPFTAEVFNSHVAMDGRTGAAEPPPFAAFHDGEGAHKLV